jgi:serine O-acetyltransferase
MSISNTTEPPPISRPVAQGDRNNNPPGLSLLALLGEDLRTHDGEWLDPGFLAVAVHRLGNWRMGIRPRLLRAPLTILYTILARRVRIAYGIKLDYVVKLGRRVRIWHHGGMVLGAQSIGDDVHIRQNTTFGLARRGGGFVDKPIIGDRVDIGCGVCILGPVRIGHDSVIGANAVVLADVPPWSLAAGVPARPRPRRDRPLGTASP